MTLGFQVLSAWGVSWLAQRSGASAGVAMCLGICLVCVAPILPLEVAAEADLYPAGFPVVVTACAWRWWGGHQVSWGRALSFAVASVAVLLWTVIGTTALAGGGTAIIAPLAVLRSWGGVTVPVDALSIAARACSDLAFPIAILVHGRMHADFLLSCWRGRPTASASDKDCSSRRPVIACMTGISCGHHSWPHLV